MGLSKSASVGKIQACAVTILIIASGSNVELIVFRCFSDRWLKLLLNYIEYMIFLVSACSKRQHIHNNSHNSGPFALQSI